MYDKLLDTFITVANLGSFTKAADQLYISHTAVRKQMVQLEERLEVKLFDRSHQGVLLTKAGQVLYAESLTLIKAAEQALQKVQQAHQNTATTFKLGSSLLYPCHSFMDIWDKLRTSNPAYQLQIVPFEDKKNRFEHIGRDFDLLIGPYNNELEKDFHFLPIGQYRFCLSVPRSHPLAGREKLSLADLAGQPLMMMKKGTSASNDQIRADIERKFPSINLIDIEPNYDLQTFNHCVERACLLLSLECWDRVHPDLKSIPLVESYTLPYGILSSLKPGKPLESFLENLTQTMD